MKSSKNVDVVYTKIQDIQKTDVPGSVLTKNTKIVVV
jgi:hypothetical protein